MAQGRSSAAIRSRPAGLAAPAVLLSALLASGLGGCGAPADAPRPPRRVAAASAGPLKLLRVAPPPGEIGPRPHLRLQFDRPLDPASASEDVVRMSYAVPPANLLEDPFRYLGTRLDRDDPSVLLVQPPELLVGTRVRLVVLPGLRGADGSAPASIGAPPEGVVFEAEWIVSELPP